MWIHDSHNIITLSNNSSDLNFDDHNLINGNRFLARESGIYQFTVNINSTARNTRIRLVVNGDKVSNIMKTGSGTFQETLLIKLNLNDYIEIIADHPSNGILRGNLSGYKL